MSKSVSGTPWQQKTRKANGYAGFMDFLAHLRTIYWWALLDLNQRPKDYESSALTN
jgi:hypothetical protein